MTLFDLDAGTGEVVGVEPPDERLPGPGEPLPPELMRAFREDALRLRPGQALRIDLTAAPDLPVLRTARELGLRSVVVIPLAVESTVIGALSLSESAERSLQPDEVRVGEEVAALLAVGIHQTRLRDALRRHADELEQRVARRTIELEVARAEAERANRAKSEFLSRMSHELRTPLNAILGFAQLLDLDDLGPERQPQVRHIVKAGRHLLDLINEVLDIARIEAGMLTLSPEPVWLPDILEEATDLVRPIAREWSVVIQGPPPHECRHTARADRQRIKQILLNLLSNAVKYNRRGGTVTLICAQPGPGRIRIGVRDTGPGIAPQMIERLFLPFDRAGAERTAVEGTGLGLTLSRRLAEAMGGTIVVESTVGAGSTFWLELPEADGVPTAGAVPADAAPGPTAAGIRGTVLYVEDNVSNLQLVEAIIALRPGVRLLTALQGRIGLDLALQHRPDVIFLDLHLPDVAGAEVLSRIKADPALREVPVYVLSADVTSGQRERLLAAGATAFLPKPIDVPRFLGLLDAALAG